MVCRWAYPAAVSDVVCLNVDGAHHPLRSAAAPAPHRDAEAVAAVGARRPARGAEVARVRLLLHGGAPRLGRDVPAV